MLEQHDSAASPTLSEHEEYVWMQQLQQPEQVMKQISFYVFDTSIDTIRLKQSIESVFAQHPDLNSRYIFSDEGDLSKIIEPINSYTVEINTLSEAQLNSTLNDLKNRPWDAATDAPFSAVIGCTQQYVILMLSLHCILEETYQLNSLFNQIKQQYEHHKFAEGALNLIESHDLALSAIQDHTVSSLALPQAQHDLQKLNQIILDEFKQLLAEPDMTENDDFFEFGGHSLLATRVIGHLQNRHGIELSFNDFFKSPTASNLAQLAVFKQVETMPVTQTSVSQAPLTFTQDFLWQAYAAFDFSPIYNLPFAVVFEDVIHEETFYHAFLDLIIRHEGLRTLFTTHAGAVVQSTVPTSALDAYTWFWYSDQSKYVTLAQEAAYQFDLSRELPIRIRFIKNDKGQQTLSLLVHHMVIDEWSLNSLMSDLQVAYFARLTQQQPIWRAPAHSIHELAVMQQQQGLNPKHIHYWTTMLKDAVYGLTLKGQIPAEHVSATPQIKWQELPLGSTIYQKVSTFSRQHQASIFSVMYSAIIYALQHIGDLREITIGTSASGRTDPKFFDTVGYLTTMVAHRTQFKPEEDFAELVRRTSLMLNESMAYADIPINHIQKALGLADDAGLIFDVYIHIHSNNALNGALNTPEGKVQYRQILPERHESMFGLHFEIMDNVIDDQHQLNLIVTYQAHRYPTVLIEQMTHIIQARLNNLNAD